MSDPPAQLDRTKIQFSLAADEGLAARLEALCEYLVKAGIAPSMSFVLKKAKLVATDERVEYFVAELRKKTARVFVSSSPSRIESADSTFFEGLTDVWSWLTFGVRVECPCLPWPRQERLLVEACDVLGALTGFVTPDAASNQLGSHSAMGIQNFPAGTEVLEMRSRELREILDRTGLTLPLIHPIYLGGVLTHSAQPQILGWLNYWSAATCEYLGFPDEKRDAALLAHSYRTPAGAWLVRLTAEPLDVSRDDHVAALSAAYARFPRLGIRRKHWRDAAGSPPAAAGQVGAVAFVQCPDSATVATKLKRLLDEGGSAVTAPRREHERVILQSHSRDAATAFDIMVHAGASGWCMIDTRPPEILADEGKSGIPLLGELCRELQAIGCLFAVRGPVDAVLMESDAEGRCRSSGCLLSEPDPSRFHGRLIDVALLHVEVMPFEVDLLDVDDYTQVLTDVVAQFGRQQRANDDPAEFCNSSG